MLCFICRQVFNCVDPLINHLKIIHGCDKNSHYECPNKSCDQFFQNISAYKKHLKNGRCNDESLTFVENKDFESKENLKENENYQNITKKSTIEYEYSIRREAEDIYKSDCRNKSEAINIEDMKRNLIENMSTFTLTLHNNNNFSRKDVINIQDDVMKFILNPLNNCLKKYSSELCQPDSEKLENFLNKICSAFEEMKTEYRLLKYLEKNDLYIKPKEFDINREISNVNKKGVCVLTEKVEKGILMNLHFQFRKVFEKNNALNKSLAKMEEYYATNSNLRHFIQGKLWQEKRMMYQGKIIIPFFLYADEFEVNNPLGSHTGTQSVTAFYYSFPLLENLSKLNQIHLAALIKSQNVKYYGNDLTMNELIKNITLLETEGITFMIENKATTVHFIMGLILGDNLGLNQILEFSKSFSASYFCRFCIDSKQVTSTLCTENLESIRNIENYKDGVSTSDVSLTGIFKNSIWNKIPSFHVTSNLAVDIMHDVFEGVAHYNLAHILEYYIEKNIFSLDDFNKMKREFSYGDTEVKNICKDISRTHIKKRKFNTSAREMWTLVHYLPLIIGHLVPVNDKIWVFVTTFIKLLDYLLLSAYDDKLLNNLRILIEEHNKQYTEFFKDTLKPKHHNLIHYPRIISYSGPPKLFWCFRFEAKHRELKTYAKIITSRKNLLLSFATKFQLKFAYNLLKVEYNSLDYKEHHQIESSNAHLFSKKLNAPSESMKYYDQIRYHGTLFKKDHILSITSKQKIEFYKIFEISVLEKKEAFILCFKIPTCFNDHFMSYELLPNDAKALSDNLLHVKSIRLFDGPPVNFQKLSTGKTMIRPKIYFNDDLD